MQRLKSENGITVIALAITVIVLILISVPIIVNSTGVIELAKYSKFKDDIDNLRENISVAFNSENLSAIGPTYNGSLDFLNLEQNGKKVKNDNDNNIYYAINVSEINKRLPTNMKELNYGDENSKIGDGDIYFGTSDVYIINDASRTIYYVKGITYKDNTFYRLPEDFSSTEYGIKPGEIVKFNKYFTDKEGNIAKIPVGFKVSDKEEEQIVSKGLVISDEQGNEFVWIPVNSLKNEKDDLIEIKFDRYIYGSQVKGDLDNVYQSTKIYNNDGDEYFFYESDNNFEKLSILQNKGFYIARYEAGSNIVRTDSSTNDAPIVKKGINVYNYIKRDDAKKLAENFIINDNISSRLCSSQAWDTALQFLKQTGNDSYLTDSSLGNYNGTLKTTGGSTSVNNIFDLGGNVSEWTTELYSDDSLHFTVRGGSVENTSSASPATSRIATGDIKSANTGFRITLFLSANASSVPLDNIDVGDVVNYTPDTNTNTFSLTSAMSGYDTDQDIKRENYTWKVLNKNSDGSVDIMGVPTAEIQEVFFYRPTGYNNGVYYLNEICNQLYSNNALGATARSINIDDIESKMNSEGIKAKKSYYNYDEELTCTEENAWYPILSEYENQIGIDSDIVKTNGIGESDNGTELTQIKIPLLEVGMKQANKFVAKSTYYKVEQKEDFYDDKNFYGMIFNSKSNFWVASRYKFYTANNNIDFGIRNIRKMEIQGGWLFTSNDVDHGANHPLCPVVHINNDIKWSQKDDGSWTISK